MKKLFRRVFAYLIDMMVVILIAQCISGIPLINRQLDAYNKSYDDYEELYEDYANFKIDLSKSFEDKELTEDEYNDLIEEHEDYVDTLNKYYKDSALTEKNYDKLNEVIDKEYIEEYKNIYFKIEKNSVCYMVIYLIVVFAYFVGFNMITKGQTLGKKLTRLRIVNSKDVNKKVAVWSYIVRALILYQPIYYIVKLIGVNFMGINTYYEVTSVIYNIQGYLEMLILVMLMMRTDGRGPQDMLAMTRVALFGRDGKELEDKPDMISKKIDELKSKNKKIIDEPTK